VIKIKTPTKAYIPEESFESFSKALSYKNKAIAYELNRITHNKWFKKSSPDEWQVKVNELKALVNGCLVYRDKSGPYIRAGSIPYLIDEGVLLPSDVQNEIEYPKARPYRWYNPLPFTLYHYQAKSVELLLEERHGAVSLCTGAGKSAIILKMAQALGLPTIISVPSESIFSELLKAFEYHFGKDSVGCIGDGKKRLGKIFTVCIADSLTNLKEGTDAYDHVKKAKVLLTDESHTFAAETLDEVCHGVLSDIPYRFFLSGTQTRADGTKKVLESIIGKVVYSFSTEEAIKGGFVCDHEFRILPVASTFSGPISRDPLINKRNHLLRNTNIRDFIAKLSNLSWNKNKHQTLVLIEELSQIVSLVPHITVPFAVATSASNKNAILATVTGVSEKVIKEDFDFYFEKLTPDQLNIYNLIKNSDSGKAVDMFNRGEVHVLIGTSCIATGTNIFPTHNTVNWVGGSSETKTKQGTVGRSVRMLEKSKYKDFHVPKPKVIIWDFDVMGLPDLEVHLFNRIRYYKDSGVEIRRMG